MKIAVIAGTIMDTKMGYDILKAEGLDCLDFPVAKTPKEQTQLQYSGKEKVEEVTRNVIKEAISHGCDGIFLYCNSLSSSIDYKKLERELNVPIVAPLDCYAKYSKEYANIAVLAGNGNSAREIERILKESNASNNSILIGNLMLAEAIEENMPAEEIISVLALDLMVAYLEKSDYKGNKMEALILGCTHFPYVKNELKKITKLVVLDPKDDMIELLKDKVQKSKE
ncbi:MAG: racemase [Tissierellia bacterium]|nr:racemase [Tissierellia bacterium]